MSQEALYGSLSPLTPTPEPPPATPRGATPVVASKSTGSDPFTSQHYNRDERIAQMRDEITGKVVGPVPARQFLDAFLPSSTDKSMPWNVKRRKAFESIKSCKKEKEIYGKLVKAVQPFCKGLQVVDTSYISYPTFKGKLIKPDVCSFSSTPRIPRTAADQDDCVYDDDPADKTYVQKGSEEEKAAKAFKSNIKSVEFMKEIKLSPLDDPFQDDVDEDHPFEKAGDSDSGAKHTLGQVTNYATAHLSAQFRTHIFSVLVFPTYGRLLRWDRAGVIVSEKIPLGSKDFAKFFWRYSHATSAERGVDETVSCDLRDFGTSQAQAEVRKLLGLKDNAELLRVSLGKEKSDYIIGAKTYMGTSSPTGRATRVFKAVSCVTRDVVFLKDTWRVTSRDQLPEHEVYERLHAHHVPHIAHVRDAADIMNHTTLTKDFCKTLKQFSWRNWNSFRSFQHYRLVLEEIGRDLTMFTSTKELTTAVLNAVVAHRCAFAAGILHRDISPGNILIIDKGGGLLIDWDLCKNLLSSIIETIHVTERTGTWQFMSARLLLGSNDGKQLEPTREDDVESFFYVITWVALLYTMHGTSPQNLAYDLHNLFDSSYYGPGDIPKGGSNKKSAIKSGDMISDPGFKNPPLARLLTSLVWTLAVRYDAEPSDTEKDDYKYSLAKGMDVEILNRMSSYGKHLKKLENMQNQFWLEDEMKRALEDSDWHVDGHHVDNEVSYRNKAGVYKRRAEEDIRPERRHWHVPTVGDIVEEV